MPDIKTFEEHPALLKMLDHPWFLVFLSSHQPGTLDAQQK
jgi:hypothetical protein